MTKKWSIKVEYINFKYSVINPQNLTGINEFNQEFFDKIDKLKIIYSMGLILIQ